MNIAVVAEVILSSKGFATEITRIRTLVSVGTLMDEKVVRFCELTITKLTDKLFLWPTRFGSSLKEFVVYLGGHVSALGWLGGLWH